MLDAGTGQPVYALQAGRGWAGEVHHTVISEQGACEQTRDRPLGTKAFNWSLVFTIINSLSAYSLKQIRTNNDLKNEYCLGHYWYHLIIPAGLGVI